MRHWLISFCLMTVGFYVPSDAAMRERVDREWSRISTGTPWPLHYLPLTRRSASSSASTGR